MVTVRLKRLPHGEGLPVPAPATPHSSGMDLRAAITGELVIKPFERLAVPTGFVWEIPTGFEGQVRTRSGLALKDGIICLNSPGTVDADYRGEVKVILANLSSADFKLERGMRIAQMVIAPFEQCRLVEADHVTVTERGSGGFGHTGTS
ncbi:MAG TPA: dUTP diphosphatase [Acidobacteriota bacterium]|nr:dUTP diphosphatase [Acidobacteriota bacterium]HQO20524.1 dUTP diphosphatase [Acidobacteriota bacterium]HQQ47374.1 dUTP diphosphatase [Acidobacteriota bacterium]